MEAPCSAAILAGGASRRFGGDKAFATWRGRTLLAHALTAVAPFGVTRVIAGDAARAAHLRTVVPPAVIVLPDDEPGHGPLGGLATALRTAEPGTVAVLAVDLPLLTPAFFLHLASSAPAGAKAAAIRHADGRWEPLAALYRTDLAAAAQATRDWALHRFLAQHGAAAIAPGAFTAALANVNTRADAAALGDD
jgi:molybdopterin-guanine dinucleotide biosynthesis protein A